MLDSLSGAHGCREHFHPISPLHRDVLTLSPVDSQFINFQKASTPYTTDRTDVFISVLHQQTNFNSPSEHLHTSTSFSKQRPAKLMINSFTSSKSIPKASFASPLDETLNNIDVDTALVEYLVRHGALSDDVGKFIMEVEDSEKKSLLFNSLCASEGTDTSSSMGKLPNTPSFALLLNALRHTGQHSVANLLDYGRRITPSPCSKPFVNINEGNISNSSQRLRGQLCLRVQLSAIKIDPKAYDDFKKSTDSHISDNNGSSLNQTVYPSGTKGSQMLPSSVQYLTPDKSSCTDNSLWINQPYPTPVSDTVKIPIDSSVAPVKEKKRPTGCFTKLCQLFGSRKKHKKAKLASKSAAKPKIPVHVSTVLPVNPCNVIEKHDFIKSDPSPEKLAILDTKSEEFCQLVCEQDSSLHDALVKYMEQSCNVVVLDTQPNTFDQSPTLLVNVVAFKLDVVKHLSDTCQPIPVSPSTDRQAPRTSCRLADNLSKTLIEAGLLKQLNVQDIRLSCKLDEEEVLTVTRELNNFNE